MDRTSEKTSEKGKIYHNIGILAHVDSGKTTLTEQLLYFTGALREAGSVDKGSTITDSLEIERQRGISVRTSAASAQYNGVSINIIDTPGHIDFAGEVERSLAALDYAVVVVSAVEGVRAHTENILKALDAGNIPRLVFINKIDRAGSDTGKVIRTLASLNESKYLLLSETENEGFESCTSDMLGTDELYSAAEVTLAELDERAADAFLIDEALPRDELDGMMKKYISDCTLTPVLCGSAKLGIGIEPLCRFMTSYMPSSLRRATDGLCGIIFKIEHDRQMGKVAYVRLFGGKISNRDEVTLLSPDDGKKRNPEGEEDDAVEPEKPAPVREKVTQIRRVRGGKYTDAGEVEGGDIAALCGLSSAKTGHFVGSLELGGAYKLVSPFLRVRVTPRDNDPEKIPALAEALSELSDEEPYINAKWENGQKEITISTTGKIQLEVIDSLLRERYNLEASFDRPTVIYKETPSRAGIAYADYTMPKPCWAVVEFRFEPMPRGYGVSYHGRLPSNQLFYKYQTHIRTSFYSCLEQGLYGWEVTDFRCTLIGGQHHTIHTHPLDFFVCTPMAFMNGLQSLGSTILEPLLKMRVSCPTSLAGRIISEIAKIGGEYDSPLTFGDTSVVEAIVPAATSMEFPTTLASLSSGKAALNVGFYGYRECRDGKEHVNPRVGVNPLDRSKWILWARGAYRLSQD